MKALDRKLLRDLRLMWSQALTIALVVASSVAGFITTFSAYDALSWSRDLYYADARFADVFATLKRAPLSLERQFETIAGAAHVETSLTELVPITIPNVADPIIGRLIGLDARSPQRLNKVHLRSGLHDSGASQWRHRSAGIRGLCGWAPAQTWRPHWCADQRPA
ncbi:hypothetical protein [Rhodoferax ferrireducens]|uniref:hypothetical protein n=1 Tax=Rhodoferax ferrireducens TaxID=192843 RepID=UPI003BB7E932